MLPTHLVALLAALGGLTATASPCRPRPRPSAPASVSAAPVVASPSGATNDDPTVTSPLPSILPSSVSAEPSVLPSYVSVTPEASSASVAPEASAAPEVSASVEPSASVAPEASAAPSEAPEASVASSVSAAPSEVASASVAPVSEASVAPVSEASVAPVSEASSASDAASTASAPAATTTATGSAPVYTDAETGAKTPLPPQDPTLITANPTAADEDGSSEVARAILKWTNDFRAQFDAPPLTWDSSKAKETTNWAKACAWEHAGSDNLNAAFSSAPEQWTGTSRLTGWANEYTYYPFANPTDDAASHFSQMVWKGHTQMGCSWNLDCGNTIHGEGIDDSFKQYDYSILFSCKYSEGGNMGYGNGDGQYYKINVGNWVNA